MYPNVLSSGIQPVETSLFPHLTSQMAQLQLTNDVTAMPADLHTADA